MRALPWIVTLSFAASCGGTVRGYAGRGEPTCRAACDHYTTCAGLSEDEVFLACITECKEIFYDGDNANVGALQQFQNMRCAAAIKFVEGDGGPPGRHDKRVTRGEKK